MAEQHLALLREKQARKSSEDAQAGYAQFEEIFVFFKVKKVFSRQKKF